MMKKAKGITLISKACKGGVTLIEIILYVSLLAMFLLVLTDIFIGGLNLQLESESTSAVQTDGQFILSRLMYDLKNADSVTTPASLGSSSNSLVLVSSGITYTYDLSDGYLNLTKSGETLALNSLETSITSINFKRLGNASGKPTLQVSLSIQSKTIRQSGQPEKRDFQTTLGLR